MESLSEKYGIPDIEGIFSDFFVCKGHVSAHLTILNGTTACEHGALEVPGSIHKDVFRSFFDFHIRFHRRTSVHYLRLLNPNLHLPDEMVNVPNHSYYGPE